MTVLRETKEDKFAVCRVQFLACTGGTCAECLSLRHLGGLWVRGATCEAWRCLGCAALAYEAGRKAYRSLEYGRMLLRRCLMRYTSCVVDLWHILLPAETVAR